jgi:hypothetical protein
VHGLAQEETCICKTTDDGNECIDGADCQGDCVVDGTAEFQAMDANDPTLGYFKGHCAPYDTTFGCFTRIPDGTHNRLPLAREEASELICVD